MKCLYYFLLAPFLSHAQVNNDVNFIHSIAVEVLGSDAADRHLTELTKNIGHRLSGSPQMYAAEKWGARVFTEVGAESVVWQECSVPHWVRGGEEKGIIFFKKDGISQSRSLRLISMGNAVGTGTEGVAGEVISVHNFAELDQLSEAVKGRIVFFDVPFEDTLIETGLAYGSNVKYRVGAASAAARYGARAVMVRSMTHYGDNVPHTGTLRYDEQNIQIPSFALGMEDVSFFQHLLNSGQTPVVTLFSYCQMLPDTIAHNIIGIISGSQFPEKVITIGGHLDSWDVGEGAHDDGAGIVHTLEVLRVFKKLGYRPKSTLHFVMFANEENGTRGGQAYAQMLKDSSLYPVFALESDAGGFTPRGFGITASDTVLSKISEWKDLFTPYFGERFSKGGGGADIGFLHNQFGTPVAGLDTDGQRYFDLHHTSKDVLETVNFRELKLGAINMAALIYLVDKYGL
jgi:hypothetical protein